MKHEYHVIVGNVGTVHAGTNQRAAMKRYRSYVATSQVGVGRAGNEPVTLMRDGEPMLEYDPPNTQGETYETD